MHVFKGGLREMEVSFVGAGEEDMVEGRVLWMLGVRGVTGMQGGARNGTG